MVAPCRYCSICAFVGVVVDATPDYAHGLVFVSFWFCCTIGAGLVVAAFEYRFWAIVIGSTLTLSCLVYLACVGVPSVPDKETIQSIARYGGVVTGILNLFALAAGYYCTHGRF